MAEVELRRRGAVAEIVLDRPERRNALNAAMWAAIAPLVREAEADAEIRVLVLRGAHDTVFAAGADIAELQAFSHDPEAARAFGAAVREAQGSLAACAKPTIARIAGPCFGGGCGLALACDFRFADETARFAITPARLGLVYALADTKRLVDVVGPSAAKDILFTGRILDAEEALRIRLVDRLVPAGGLDDAVASYSELLARAAPTTIRGAKDIVAMILSGASDDTPETTALFAAALTGPDFREGARAFLEKRPPDFRGRADGKKEEH
ncbi:MAG: enoyl-CoA hydratase/isomerase family protein [Alphaproteobacteria bacterium]|nr:enoyl-CoA hydratase/isomerase family protein [Alphaproteobacteria bacterium]